MPKLHILKCALIISIATAPTQAIAMGALRPLAAHQETGSELSVPGIEIIEGLLGARQEEDAIPVKPVRRLSGNGTSPSTSAIGNAALLSHYSAENIMYSVGVANVQRELKQLEVLYLNLRSDIEKQYSGRQRANRQSLLDEFYNWARQYYRQIKDVSEQGALIKDRYELLWQAAENHAAMHEGSSAGAYAREMQSLIRIKAAHNQQLVTDPSKEADDLRIKAGQEWKKFLRVKTEIAMGYQFLKAEQGKRREEIRNSIRLYLTRNKELSIQLQATEEAGEISAIQEHIQRHIGLIREGRQAAREAETAAELYNLYIKLLDYVEGKILQGPEAIAKRNSSVEEIIYSSCCIRYKQAMDKSIAQNGGAFKAITDTLRFFEDLIGHLKEVTPVYLSVANHGDEIILFTKEDIGIAQLYSLTQKYNIKGIVSLSGTTASHWAIVAAQIGIPVVFLMNTDEPIKAMVDIGDEVIVQTKKAEKQSRVVIRPDALDKMLHERRAAELDLYRDLCRSEVSRGETRNATPHVSILGNVATPNDLKNIMEQDPRPQHGVGLHRTEIALEKHATMLKALVEAAIKGDEQEIAVASEIFIGEHSKYMEEFFTLFRYSAGPYTIRTFDIEPDKNRDLLSFVVAVILHEILDAPDNTVELFHRLFLGRAEAYDEELRNIITISADTEIDNITRRKTIRNILGELAKREFTGFNLYRTTIGKYLLPAQMVSIFDALRSNAKDGYAFTPRIMFPQIRDNSDVEWVFDNIVEPAKAQFQKAQALQTHNPAEKAAIQATSASIFSNIEYGIMAETTDAIKNREGLVRNPKIQFVSVGTNDLISGLLSELLSGANASRDNNMVAHLFFEMFPNLILATDQLAAAIVQWNQGHPENPKALGFCGEIASREKFLIYAASLKARYKNLQVSLSMPAKSIPIIEYLRLFIRTEHLNIFPDDLAEGFEGPVDGKAAAAVERIYGVIIEAALFKERVQDGLMEFDRKIEALKASRKASSAGNYPATAAPYRLPIAAQKRILQSA